ncbi:MAG: Phosphatidyl-N-methylethanolamine N-methyltransferase [Cirrosporium novae-zelandiae]|nr:MAG: Phosphatidyl-N-methylethanolamine N-methyltransferase [Cirrosporium novae-zelandiae]
MSKFLSPDQFPVNFSQPSFWEYHQHILTRTFGSPHQGCYALAVAIFLLGLFRDSLYERALRTQPPSPYLATSPLTVPLSLLLLAVGNTLVLTSMYTLGITGTYLGDYFGILMDDMVTGFPFSVCSAPMYYGSTMSFLGTALWFGKGAGVLLTVEVLLVYLVALRFEDPFTGMIYEKRERERAKKE